VERPFREIASRMGVEEGLLLDVLRGLKEKGLMRRFSAILRHRKAGFRANGMVVWRVPEERLEEVGRFLAGFKCVSHCYERTGWHYNLFSMVHGRVREEVEEFVRRVSGEVGIRDYEVLFSGREFVKRRTKIFTEDFYEWERRELGAGSHQGEDSEGCGKAVFQKRI
jgi:DNA-binding Lrp family transcriptional regulator